MLGRKPLNRRFFAADQRVHGIEVLDYLASVTTAIGDSSRESPPRIEGLSRRRQVLATQGGAVAPTIESLLGEPEERGLGGDVEGVSERAASLRFAGGARIRAEEGAKDLLARAHDLSHMFDWVSAQSVW